LAQRDARQQALAMRAARAALLAWLTLVGEPA
jgi:hypothetical protein